MKNKQNSPIGWPELIALLLSITIVVFICYGVSTQCEGSSMWKGNYINCSEVD